MYAKNFPEANRVIGRPNGMTEDECNPLHVADAVYMGNYPVIISCWELTDEERERIANGADIYLHVLGGAMLPVIISTEVECLTIGGN